MFTEDLLEDYDPDISRYIKLEAQRQEDHIELIASENYTSPQVMEAQGSCLTNKYAEGYSGKRYYGGCEHIDKIEDIAIERVKKLYGVKYANVQPHSGSSANAAAFLALIKPGDKIMGMALSEGGHLTHGAKVSFSGQIYDAVEYGINEDGDIDYDGLEEKAHIEQPKLIIAGFSAFSGIVDWARMRKVADRVNAFLLADISHVSGLVAAGVYPSPVDHAHVITTTTHKTLRGPRSGLMMTNDETLAKKINSAIFPGYQGGPLVHVIAAKAIAFAEALKPEFKTYQQQVLKNADAMANQLIERNIKVIGNGTQNHLMLVSLIDRELTGKEMDTALGRAHITINKNTVPNDPQSPFITSGIRLGSPAVTTRGFKEEECKKVADMVADVIDARGAEDVILDVKKRAIGLCGEYPVYPY
ncbi:MAG: serine hydroxymethyltransferase [Pseudomonadota bacterium]